MKKVSAETLLELVLQSLNCEVRPALAPEARYELAMCMRALEMARRELQCEPEAGQWDLLDYAYDDGEGTMPALAADILAGKINDETHPDLRLRLERLLLSELEVRNPRAIRSRGTSSPS
ncbi:MAG: DUF6285 domain-containing protein [Hyphomicrobiaceae bacterium]